MDTRQQILSEALRAFSQDGYAGTSMRHLASQVGIKAASLYAHFPSKQAILEALLLTAGPNSAAAQLAGFKAMDPPFAPAQLIHDFIEKQIESWSGDEARLFRSMVSRLGAEYQPEARYLQGIKTLLLELGSLFEGWMAEGLMHRHASADVLAWTLLAPLGNLRTSFWSVEADQSDLEEGRRLARAHLALFISLHFDHNNKGVQTT